MRREPVTERLLDMHQGRSLFQHAANAARRYFARGQYVQRRLSLRCFQRDEKTAGSLRIEEKIPKLFRNQRLECSAIADELPIILESAGMESVARGGDRTGKIFDGGVIDLQRHAASDGHFAGVAEQRETRHVGDGVNRSGTTLFDFR